MKKQISERHARSLLKLESQTKQNELLKRIIDERLTVRKTDEEIEKMMNNEGNNEVFNFDIDNLKLETKVVECGRCSNNCEIVSTDKVRMDNPDLPEKDVWPEVYKRCSEALKENRDVIYDDGIYSLLKEEWRK